MVGTIRIIDTSAVRHTIIKHGDAAKEAKRGQIGITIDDFNKLPLILKEPDNIKYVGKNQLKQDVFLYQKKIGGIYFVAESVKIGKRGDKMIFQSMYKRKKE